MTMDDDPRSSRFAEPPRRIICSAMFLCRCRPASIHLPRSAIARLIEGTKARNSSVIRPDRRTRDRLVM